MIQKHILSVKLNSTLHAAVQNEEIHIQEMLFKKLKCNYLKTKLYNNKKLLSHIDVLMQFNSTCIK